MRCPKCKYKITIKDESKDFIKCAICDTTFKTSTLFEINTFRESIEAPKETKIEFEKGKKGEYLQFFIPSHGLQPLDTFALLFQSFQLLFILILFFKSLSSLGVYTFLFFFLLLFFLKAVKLTIVAISEKEEIIFESKGLLVKKKNLISSHSYSIPYSKIVNISLKKSSVHLGMGQYKLPLDLEYFYYPTIFYGTEELSFGKYLSLEEIDWLIDELKYSILYHETNFS